MRHKLKPRRENITIGRYTMLQHRSVARTRTHREYEDMKLAMKVGVKRADVDGLNSLTYIVNEVKSFELYTRIRVNLLQSNDPEYSPANSS